MRINSINATSFGGAEKLLPNQKLRIVGKVDGYVDQMLREGFGEIESLAEVYKVTLHQNKLGFLLRASLSESICSCFCEYSLRISA